MTPQEMLTEMLAIIERFVPDAETRAAILADFVRILLADETAKPPMPVPRRR